VAELALETAWPAQEEEEEEEELEEGLERESEAG
jgi:hypothetical protein